MNKKVDMRPKELTRESKTFVPEPELERIFYDGTILECLTHEGLFNPDECAELVQMYGHDDTFFDDAQVNLKLASEGPENIPNIRKGKVQFLEAGEENVWVFEKILALVTSANDQHYHFEIDHFDALQFGKYETGHYYNNHIDIGPGRMGNRKLSLTVQLSEPDTYKGGDLVMPDLGGFVASRAVGSVTVFPSFLKHRVDPVTEGTRFSLAAWIGGTHRFR